MTDDLQTRRLLDAADKVELNELVMRYSRAIDRRDYAQLFELYHPDSFEDHGAVFQGNGHDFVRLLVDGLGSFERTVHYAVNALFAVDGDRAQGEIYKISYHRTPPPEALELITGSRSHDEYIRTPDGWRFLRRAVTMDWARQGSVDLAAYGHAASGDQPAAPSQPAAEDASYDRLSLFVRGRL